MEVRSYNAELAIANLCFKRIFSNIQIERTDSNGVTNPLPIVCQFDQRSRILKNWENSEKRSNMKLPLIAINRTGYTRNGERLNNFNNEVKYEISSKNRNYNLLTPVPIDISYDVCVVAKYPSDIDQIASNFMVFFNNDVYVTCQHPKYEGISMNNQIVMSDSVSEEHQNEMDGTADDLITSTFQFTFKTYLFGGMQQASKKPVQVLSAILSTFVDRNVVKLQPNEIDEFQKKYPDMAVSATLEQIVTRPVDTMVNNPELSDTIYDEYTPMITHIDVGFYETHQDMNHIDHMNMTDSIEPLSDQQWHVDRLIWKISENSFNSDLVDTKII